MVRAGFNCWLSQLTAALLVYHRDATGEGRTECTMRCTATIACPLHVAFFSLVDAQKRNSGLYPEKLYLYNPQEVR
jgi:hypothetical protein